MNSEKLSNNAKDMLASFFNEEAEENIMDEQSEDKLSFIPVYKSKSM